MNLKLVKIKNKQGVYYIKEYKYKNYKIRVEIEPDNHNIYIIHGENEKGDCEIIMTYESKHPSLTLPSAIIIPENANSFFKDVKEGIETLKLIEENKKELIKVI